MLFFKKNIRSLQKIEKYTSLPNSIDSLSTRIKTLDYEIAETSKNIFQAQLVRVRTLFSGSNNFFQGLQQRFVETSATNSLLWHQERLVNLSAERKFLQSKLDRMTGQTWPKRFRKLLSLITIFFLISFICFIFIIGIAAAIYILPTLVFVLMLFLLFRRFISNKNY
ncbi:Sema domain-containing protein [Prochlorococcus sp. MIT 1223]|uniref:Sema domain-containing protein n=1 Tax=Prochlorococcus sp. MIT 1223 TaxID=3096217 RepID=UPI002A76032F|nr:Sema domain-containing protein [Prochlorococcus sp. MIT 1223]